MGNLSSLLLPAIRNAKAVTQEDVPMEQYGANENDLYVVGGTVWGLVNYMLTEIISPGKPE